MRVEMERRIQKYKKMGNFTIEPWDSRYYALFDGDQLICVTAYKIGAIEVMKRLTKARKCQDCPINRQFTEFSEKRRPACKQSRI